LVTLVPLNIKDEDSIAYVLSQIDNAVQYGEDLEPKEIVDKDMDEE
jgi:GPN-loop GTPase